MNAPGAATRLLVATNNAGKLREYRDLLSGLPVDVVSPADENIDLVVDESGQTFAENAALKARAFAQVSGLLALADDSGLEVDALNGEPGVYSARYGGPKGTDATRYTLLLKRLERVPWEQRGARFRCAVAVAAPGSGQSPEVVVIADGRCEGFVARAPRGENGFGYDPVFYVPQFGLHMAELPPETKNQISHRARAVQAARAAMARELFPDQNAAGRARGAPLHLSELKIRPARLSDSEALQRKCYDTEPPGFAEKRLGWALAGAERGRVVPLVGETSSGVVAYVQLIVRGSTGELSGLVVTERLRGKGIGTTLAHVILEVARDRNVRVLTVAVDPDVFRLQRFYRKLGFVPYRVAYRPGFGYADEALYLKRSLR